MKETLPLTSLLSGVIMIVPCCVFSQKTIPDGTEREFWRITPTVNWYLTEYLRFELSYGYGILDRFNLKVPRNSCRVVLRS